MRSVEIPMVLQAVRDACADPAYSAIRLLEHRSGQPRHVCDLALQRAAEQDLIARAWARIPNLTEEGVALAGGIR